MEPTQPPSDPSPPMPQPTPPPPQMQPPPSSQLPPSPLPSTPSSSSSFLPSSSPPIVSSSNPNPKTLTPLLQPESQSQQQQIQQPEQDIKQDQQFSGFQSAQNRPALARHWQQQSPSHLSHFHPHHLPGMPGPSTTTSSSSPVVSAPPRGSTAIGVPAIRPGMSPQPNAFSSSFGYGGVPRNPPNMSEPPTISGPSTVRPAMHPGQTMGMISSHMQPGNHQQRPHQLSYRPQASPVNQPSPSQNFQGQGIMRPSSVGSPSPGVASTSVGTPQNQAWLPPVSHGRPPIAIPPSRPPLNSQSLQQKSQMTSQPHHAMPPPSQQQQLPSSQQQQPPTKLSNQQREHPGQQLSASRNPIPQSLPSQQQIPRVQGSANLKSSSVAVAQSNIVQPVTNDIAPVAEIDESNKRIIGKRSIQELVTQIDPSEKLDPEVEDILVDIAEEFVESITTFGCSLAKHRRSTTLEAKDILLHLERNWNMTLPGFGGDEIKTYKKPLTNDIHRERLTVVRKSIAGADSGNTKVQPSANAKGHLAKALPNASGP